MIKPDERIIATGGEHIVVCNGKQHYVIVEGTRRSDGPCPERNKTMPSQSLLRVSSHPPIQKRLKSVERSTYKATTCLAIDGKYYKHVEYKDWRSDEWFRIVETTDLLPERSNTHGQTR